MTERQFVEFIAFVEFVGIATPRRIGARNDKEKRGARNGGQAVCWVR